MENIKFNIISRLDGYAATISTYDDLAVGKKRPIHT
jgi:hypothetical protein